MIPPGRERSSYPSGPVNHHAPSDQKINSAIILTFADSPLVAHFPLILSISSTNQIAQSEKSVKSARYVSSRDQSELLIVAPVRYEIVSRKYQKITDQKTSMATLVSMTLAPIVGVPAL